MGNQACSCEKRDDFDIENYSIAQSAKNSILKSSDEKAFDYVVKSQIGDDTYTG